MQDREMPNGFEHCEIGQNHVELVGVRRLNQFQGFQSTELLEREEREKESKLARCVVHVRQCQRNDLLRPDVMQNEVEVRHANRLEVQPVSIVRVQDIVETNADVV